MLLFQESILHVVRQFGDYRKASLYPMPSKIIPTPLTTFVCSPDFSCNSYSAIAQESDQQVYFKLYFQGWVVRNLSWCTMLLLHAHVSDCFVFFSLPQNTRENSEVCCWFAFWKATQRIPSWTRSWRTSGENRFDTFTPI